MSIRNTNHARIVWERRERGRPERAYWAPWGRQWSPVSATLLRPALTRATWERLKGRDAHPLGLLGPIVGRELGYCE